MLEQSIDDALRASAELDWAVSIRDAAGCELACRSGDRVMNTASIGKLLLLVEVARQGETGELDGATMLRKDPELAVADSGLWQHLRVDTLSVDDLCVLIAGVSDNLATNVVLARVGLRCVVRLTESLGLTHTALLDVVRDHRGLEHPPSLSTGSASELSRLMSQLSRGDVVCPAVSRRVSRWLTTGVDLSMVASAFGLDPLAHLTMDRNIHLYNKTGSDPGVRADVGTVTRGARRLSYAVIANWDSSADRRDEALTGMSAIGTALAAFLGSD